jgi:TolA-binding protein
MGRRLVLILLCVAVAPRAARAADRSMAQLNAEIEQVAGQVANARADINLVEKQYSQREEPSDEAARQARYADAELQHALENYTGAATLFYDLVADKDFHKSRMYGEALFYLADSLYQQKNYLGARLYLRQLLALKGPHYREGLARYLEIAGRMNEFAGIDEYINQARGLSGGELPPELSYVYAKWMFRREDLALEDRVRRAMGTFKMLADVPDGALYLQSAYFLGVGHVKLKEYDQAIEVFKRVAAARPRGEREAQVKELANLSLGRVLYETGKYSEAVDRYQEIQQNSVNFVDAMYETAWTYVKMGELKRALNTVEILRMVSEDTVVEPEARILQGTLLVKLQKYEEATENYEQVINRFAPVRDEIDALLTVNKDPVKYFDDLLSRNDKALDVSALLPPIALKWASTRREVGDAVEVINQLEAGRRGVGESQDIANRILKVLDERGTEAFPLLQAGVTRADAVDTSVTRAEQTLTRIEGELASTYLSADQSAALATAQNDADALRQRIDTLPTTEAEVTARKERMQARIDQLDQQVFRAQLDAQSAVAQLTAITKFVDDTRAQRKDAPEDEKAFLERVSNEKKALDATMADLEQMHMRLLEERTNASAAISGEDQLKKDYAAALEKQKNIFREAKDRLPGDARQALLRCDVIRADATAVRERVASAKAVLRERVQRRSEKFRATIQAEQALLEGYGRDVAQVSGNARDLVGRIAFDSFRRVRQQFYDLVLKADVGVVDVAFTRKQDKTVQIQKLSAQKDRELKALDEEFKEVLKDVD